MWLVLQIAVGVFLGLYAFRLVLLRATRPPGAKDLGVKLALAVIASLTTGLMILHTVLRVLAAAP